jgi:ABC-type microcin C transport system permease subunit YejE
MNLIFLILIFLTKFLGLIKEDERITIHLKGVGNAPVVNKNKIKAGGYSKFATIGEFLKGAFKNVIKDNESLFLYCNSNFAPSPNAYIRDLYNNFGVAGELIVYYAISEAWG